MILVIPLQNIYCDNVYPGDTIFIQPSVQTDLIFPLRENYDAGGTVQFELLETGLFLDMLSLGISSEYRFYSQAGTATQMAGIGIRGAYTFVMSSGFSLTPDAGFDLIIPFAPDADISSELNLGCRLNLHLYKRSKIFIDSSISIPFSADLPFLLSLGIGVRQSIPIMIPLTEVIPELVLSTRLFSPDGDGEDDTIEIVMNMKSPSSVKSWAIKIINNRNKTVFARKGNMPPSTIQWDGYADNGVFVSSADDYTIEYTVTDKIGRISTLNEQFVVDVLIISEDGKLKINIPNIIFPPQSAEFSRLTSQDDIAKNNEILIRLSEIFNRFSEYSIHIEGYANSEYWKTEEGFAAEQNTELLPLSLSRAEKIKENLIFLGIKEERITVEGFGAESPIIPFSDTENNWKNRRVEFILVK